MIFLRFQNQEQFDKLIGKEDEYPFYIEGVAVDVVGIIHRPTGVMLESAEGEYPEMAPLPGFHINLSDSVPGLEQYEIEQPTTPARVFFGAA